MKGEVSIPSSVESIFKTLYGANESSTSSTKKERLVESSAADALFSSSPGTLIPGKHLSVGFALKSIKESKTAVTWMNKLGHCAGNETLRRIDIGLKLSLLQDSSIAPPEMARIPGPCNGLAWGNWDVNIETPPGADSIHHTYGICYQNIQININLTNVPCENQASGGTVPIYPLRKRKVDRFSEVSQSQDLEQRHGRTSSRLIMCLLAFQNLFLRHQLRMFCGWWALTRCNVLPYEMDEPQSEWMKMAPSSAYFRWNIYKHLQHELTLLRWQWNYHWIWQENAGTVLV